MEFFNRRTTYDHVKRSVHGHDLCSGMSREEWHEKMIKWVSQHGDGQTLIELITERMWFDSGEPYYKVFPGMAEMMSEVSIEIPANQVRLPYKSFAILMSKDPQNQIRDPGFPRLRWIGVSEVKVESVSVGKYVISKRAKNRNLEEGDVRAVYIEYDFDGIPSGSDPQEYCFNYTLGLHDETGTVEEYLEESYSRTEKFVDNYDGPYYPSRDMIYRVIRIAIATCFFGIDRHEVVMPDLPRRKIEKRMQQKRLSLGGALRDLKKEHGQTKHWSIGHEISLPLPIADKEKPPSQEHREVSHAYMRRGHMRWQCVGEGRSQRKLTFVHPHLCRPDLPLARSHGYRIPDEKLQKT